jgi:two-component sensor histidine kinase
VCTFGWQGSIGLPSPFNNLESFLRMPRNSAEAYLGATVLVVLASLARWGLGFIGQPLLPFTTYYPAILFATYIGGFGVGGYAVALGGLFGWWAFLPPHFSFLVFKPNGQFELVTYLAVCAFIVWGADTYRRLVRRHRDLTVQLMDEQKFGKVVVEELAHRLKNKIATIQSIVSYQLRGQPQLRDAIVGRLVALSGTDDLIMAAHGHGVDLRDLLTIELGAYETSRVLMAGPTIFLPAKFALSMALLVHELATNAAKYGALSVESGVVSVHWSVSNRVLELVWREAGGPAVAQPTHRGFGVRLISGALDQFSGATEMSFETSGLICKATAKLSGSAITLPRGTEGNGNGALVAE